MNKREMKEIFSAKQSVSMGTAHLEVHTRIHDTILMTKLK